MRPDVHTGRVPPQEEGLVSLLGSLQEIEGSRGNLIINRLHALNGQRAGVLNLAIGRRFDHAARPELLLELRVLRIVRMLGLLLGVEVVEIAEKLVKAVV